MFTTILIILIVILIVDGVDAYGRANDWMFVQVGGLYVLVLVIVILLLTGQLGPVRFR